MDDIRQTTPGSPTDRPLSAPHVSRNHGRTSCPAPRNSTRRRTCYPAARTRKMRSDRSSNEEYVQSTLPTLRCDTYSWAQSATEWASVTLHLQLHLFLIAILYTKDSLLFCLFCFWCIHHYVMSFIKPPGLRCQLLVLCILCIMRLHRCHEHRGRRLCVFLILLVILSMTNTSSSQQHSAAY